MKHQDRNSNYPYKSYSISPKKAAEMFGYKDVPSCRAMFARNNISLQVYNRRVHRYDLGELERFKRRRAA